jgi:hypothetical protein
VRTRATADVEAMMLNEASHRQGAEDLLAMVGSDPAINVAFKVCSDADDDDADRVAVRNLRVLDLQTKISNYVLSHGNAALDEPQAKELKQLIEQLAETYTAMAPG